MNRLLALVVLAVLSSTCRGRVRDLSHCSGPDGERRCALELLVQIDRALDSGGTAKALASAVSGKLEATEATGWWKLTSPLSAVTVSLGTHGAKGRLDEATFVCPASLGVTLHELESSFGAYRKVHETKEASSVTFVSNPPRKVTVYASVLSPTVTPGAPVVGVSLRREPNPVSLGHQ